VGLSKCQVDSFLILSMTQIETPSEHPGTQESVLENQGDHIHEKPVAPDKNLDAREALASAVEYGRTQTQQAVDTTRGGIEGLRSDLHQDNKDWDSIGGHAMDIAPVGIAAIIGIPLLFRKWKSVIESNEGKDPDEQVSFFGRIGRLVKAVLWTGAVCGGGVAAVNLTKHFREKYSSGSERKKVDAMEQQKTASQIPKQEAVELPSSSLS
jgi:hypothetical protein